MENHIKKPVGIRIFSAIFIAIGLITLVYSLLVLHSIYVLGRDPLGIIGVMFSLPVAIIFTPIGVGLWIFKKWARIATLILCFLIVIICMIGAYSQKISVGYKVDEFIAVLTIMAGMAVGIFFYFSSHSVKCCFDKKNINKNYT